MSPRPEVLERFVKFVRLNPRLAANDSVIPLVFAAYEEHTPIRESVAAGEVPKEAPQ